MKMLVLAAIMASTSVANAELVTTTDGRKIELNLDGTYQIVEAEEKTQIQFVEKPAFFEHFAGEYGQNSMRFMPIFQNETGKTVVGYKFRATFKSAFGDEVFAFDGESSERISAGSTSTAATFFYFEDNQFIGDEPYDKLSIFQSTGTGTVATIVTAVVFEDGEVLKISQ